ncbi:hypothetical protein E2P81_ATG01635 [Venturia nashicola]|nr:hypothetical protein E2P81_ATG01635 [Venturia nashicola]
MTLAPKSNTITEMPIIWEAPFSRLSISKTPRLNSLKTIDIGIIGICGIKNQYHVAWKLVLREILSGAYPEYFRNIHKSSRCRSSLGESGVSRWFNSWSTMSMMDSVIGFFLDSDDDVVEEVEVKKVGCIDDTGEIIVLIEMPEERG